MQVAMTNDGDNYCREINNAKGRTSEKINIIFSEVYTKKKKLLMLFFGNSSLQKKSKLLFQLILHKTKNSKRKKNYVRKKVKLTL